jgi:hypothetical protein
MSARAMPLVGRARITSEVRTSPRHHFAQISGYEDDPGCLQPTFSVLVETFVAETKYFKHV